MSKLHARSCVEARAIDPVAGEALMRTYYVFQSKAEPGLRGFAESSTGEALPADLGPWSLAQQIGPDEEWNQGISRAIVAAGILENGFYLSSPVNRATSAHPVIE